MAEVAILIPTVHRHDRLRQIVVDLVTNTKHPFHVYFVMETWDTDSFEAVEHLPHTTIIAGTFGSCSVAMNRGFALSSEPIVVMANDDCEFSIKDWDVPIVEHIRAGNPVVGLNEGHGRMTCFAAADREFIKRESGVFDKDGTLYHPYKSQYVDTEFADYAKARGIWTELPDHIAFIHRHHDFGDADPNHPNYRKAKATLAEDYRTYLERKPRWEEAAGVGG